MGDFLNNFFSLLTDKTISFSKRTSFLILIVLLIILANDTFNFSFNYRTNQKIEQFKSIYSLYPLGSIDTLAVKNTLADLEIEIKTRRPVISKIKNISSEIIHNDLNLSQKIFLSKLFWANIIFIFLALVFPFVERDKKGLKNIYLGLFFIALILNVIFFLLPTFDNLIYNHIINITTEIILVVVLSIYGRRKKK